MARPVPGRSEAVRHRFCCEELTETPSGGSSRILALCMRFVNIISAYTLTLTSTPETRNLTLTLTYEALQETRSGIPSFEGIYLLGDFNTRVGTNWQAWPTCFGHFGVRRMNEKGQRLLELCCHHGLCITNSYFKCKELHKVSWRHPRSHHWHQLDLVITRRADLSSVLHTRSYNSADCDMDHSIIASKVWSLERTSTPRPRVAPVSTPVALSTPLRLSASLTGSRRHLLCNQQPATQMPNGLTSMMSSTTQPWLHLARKNARMLTGLRLAGKKCSQSRRPRGKRCWLTSRTIPQTHATLFEHLGARPSRPPATVPTSTGRTYASKSR